MYDVLPDVIPDWDLPSLAWHEQQFASLCPTCDLGEELASEVVDTAPVLWAIPGVTGLDRPSPDALPSVSPAVAALVAAYDWVAGLPSGQPDAQALVDAEALLELQQRMHVDSVGRVAEVSRRRLFELVGFRSARAWLKARRPDGDASDARLGQQLADYPILQAAVTAGEVPLANARRVAKGLGRCWPQLDRPDALIDGQPGAAVLRAIVTNTISLVCRYLNGLQEDDPRLAVLIDRGERILDEIGSQRSQVEACFTLLAEHIPTRALSAHLEELVLALLPSELEEAVAKGEDLRDLELKLKADGSGYAVRGDLTLECGERFFVALRSEATRDPDNLTDTLAWVRQREWESTDNPFTGQPAAVPPTPEPSGGEPLWLRALDEQFVPRSRGRRMHDAFNRLLGRYLEQGLGGTVNKLPVQITVTVTEPTLTGQPGALPARADSGALIPRSLVKRWWCDSHVTAFVMSLGGKALRAVHSQRTLTPLERRANQIETGGRCAGQGCCLDKPDPLHVLIPHHVVMFSKSGTTSLDETVLFCESSHRDIHEGKKTLLLRDGRYLNENGFTTPPPWPQTEPPF